MKKKTIGIFVFMLLLTVALVSATEVINISYLTKVDNYNSNGTIKEESIEKSLIKQEQDDSNPPEPSSTKVGYLSISSAAFTPMADCQWTNYGYMANADFPLIAPVNLVNGATVTKVSFYWDDRSTQEDGTILFRRNNMDETFHDMAMVKTSGDSGSGSSYDDTIDYPLIDNSRYSYYLECWLGDFIWLYGVIIEYNYVPVSVPVSIMSNEESQLPNMVSN